MTASLPATLPRHSVGTTTESPCSMKSSGTSSLCSNALRSDSNAWMMPSAPSTSPAAGQNAPVLAVTPGPYSARTVSRSPRFHAS